MVWQHQYRNKGFQIYSELIICLLPAEQNTEFLLQNHESRPTDANLFPEANTIQPPNPVHGRGQVKNHSIDCDRNHNRGQGRTNRFNTGRNRNNDEECTRCGIKGYWAHVCRTDSNLAKLYRASKERHGKIAPETNRVAHDDTFDDVMNENITHLDVDDLLDIADDVK
ncbi:uncharacterized protein LOC127260655 [Andrographis paniculata]|uniref:uncharacterized protein LOC127260655 n=1 Tax=Andrographis paniculata TaxID=175694 RepID=UPI0021E7170F|nr:uncharacterized protein LOC127260655 [Andrographis paniculata]